MNILEKILDYKFKEINDLKKTVSYSELEKRITLTNKVNYFYNSLKNDKNISIIAEIKKASPSKGIICSDFNHIEIAKEYTEIGINAISILTDKNFFSGDLKFIQEIREISELPLLRKDFIVDEIQILEAKVYGANACLLIVKALKFDRLKYFIKFCEDLELDALVEIHDKDEAKIAEDAGAKIIGINNRNLDTFEINLDTSLNVLPLLADDCLKISESGIESLEHINMLKEAGAEAFLIGTSFMKSNDKKSFYNSLINNIK